jgi:hypothetical protein
MAYGGYFTNCSILHSVCDGKIRCREIILFIPAKAQGKIPVARY